MTPIRIEQQILKFRLKFQLEKINIKFIIGLRTNYEQNNITI